MHTPNLRSFIVDDDNFSRRLYEQHLRNLGYRDTLLFDNGYDCIRKLDLRPDIIFLDHEMQPFNGLDVLRVVKQYDPNIHLMIISGNHDARVIEQALAHGAYRYIKKGENDLELITRAINDIHEKKYGPTT